MQDSPRSGIILMVLSALCFSWADIGIKVWGENLSAWLVVAVRGLVGVTGVLATVRFNFRHFMVKQWPTQALLGSSSALGFLFFILSIKYLPLSLSMPLAYLYPTIAALLSPLINKEKTSRGDWLAISLALGGVICFSQSSSGGASENLTLGLIFGLAGAFFVGLMTTLARRLTKEAVPLNVNLFYLYFCNTAVCLPLVFLLDRPLLPPAGDLAKLVILIAPISVFGFCLMFAAYRYINAHRGGTILMLEAAVASLYGLVMLGEPLTFSLVLGAGLMVTSALIITRISGR